MFAFRILLDLGLEPSQALKHSSEAAGILSTRAKHAGKPVGRRHKILTRSIHGDVAVTLEQAHQTGHLVDHIELLLGCEQCHHPALIHRIFAVATSLHQPLQSGHETLRIGIDTVDGRFDQSQEMLPHPWNAGELSSVCYLMKGKPESEFPSREGIPPFQRHDIRSHVIDDVLLIGLLVLDHEQVVLAKHSGRHPPEHHPELGTGEFPADAQ